MKPEIGNYQSQYGTLLLGNGKGNFESISNQKSGLILKGDVRGKIGIDGKEKFVIARNNDLPLVIEK